MDDPVYLTIEEAAARARVCKNTMYGYIKLGLPAFRTGRRWRIKTTDFDAWYPGFFAGRSAGTRKPQEEPAAPNRKTEVVELVRGVG